MGKEVFANFDSYLIGIALQSLLKLFKGFFRGSFKPIASFPICVYVCVVGVFVMLTWAASCCAGLKCSG